MDIRTIPYTRQKINDFLNTKNVQSILKSIKEDVSNKYSTKFCSDLQILITKVGLIISDICVEPKMENAYCSSAISYLCLDILNNRTLFNTLDNSDINSNGNAVKHTLEDVSVDIPKNINKYNLLIDALLKKFKFEELAKLKIVVDEDEGIEYTIIGDHRLSFKFGDTGTFDKYKHTVSLPLSVFNKDAKDDQIEVFLGNDIFPFLTETLKKDKFKGNVELPSNPTSGIAKLRVVVSAPHILKQKEKVKVKEGIVFVVTKEVEKLVEKTVYEKIDAKKISLPFSFK